MKKLKIIYEQEQTKNTNERLQTIFKYLLALDRTKAPVYNTSSTEERSR
jgi:hypothetical protein